MTAYIINGRAIADAWLTDLAAQVQALDTPLHLAAVCAGDDAALRSFVRLKQRAAQSIGVQFSSYFFDADDEGGARQTVQYLADDETIQGIFIELPLPVAWDVDALIALVPPSKDVDALTKKAMVPEPAVRALRAVLQELGTNVRSLPVAVVGSGRLVGQPIARWLRKEGANVEVIGENAERPDEHARNADLLIAAAGKPGLITAAWVKESATVIDFGYTKGRGDVDAVSVQKKAGALTPVPGGMGPLVVAAVLENLLTLATT